MGEEGQLEVQDSCLQLVLWCHIGLEVEDAAAEVIGGIEDVEVEHGHHDTFISQVLNADGGNLETRQPRGRPLGI